MSSDRCRSEEFILIFVLNEAHQSYQYTSLMEIIFNSCIFSVNKTRKIPTAPAHTDTPYSADHIGETSPSPLPSPRNLRAPMNSVPVHSQRQ
ncbi:hypothetical protein RRG08_065920 [Elysia crispata]|uniref:Uncharacterized protein n=1 Tax=Elysia crispata TaxID=231223 RepID=A0AAE0ZH19_9GAST|nr:hypothetical protein RRG08_065920 [Elysia crispata]